MSTRRFSLEEWKFNLDSRRIDRPICRCALTASEKKAQNVRRRGELIARRGEARLRARCTSRDVINFRPRYKERYKRYRTVTRLGHIPVTQSTEPSRDGK